MKRNLPTVLPVIVGIAVLFVFFSSGMLTGTEAVKPPAANRLQPGHAPTPFSAEEIRSGCPKHRKIVFQVEMFGKQLLFQTMEFAGADEDGTVVETVTKGTDGKPVGKRQMVVAKWKDLQAHASFPEAQTEIRSEKYTTPAGTFECWLYTVNGGKDGKTQVKRYWFARTLPGPPLCFEEEMDGRVVYRMKMLKTGSKKR